MKVLPGTSWVLTLIAKTDGFYFSTKQETEEFKPEFKNENRKF